jgi:hypothetical protein
MTEEMSYEQKRKAVGDAFDKWYREAYHKKDKKDEKDGLAMMGEYCYVKETYEDFIVVEKEGETYKVGYSKKGDEFKFDEKDDWEKGIMKFVEQDEADEDEEAETARKIIDEEDDSDNY